MVFSACCDGQRFTHHRFSEQVPTQWARRVIALAEPFVQANGVELFLASFAGQLWKRIIRAVDDRKTHHAILHSFESLVHIFLPQN